MTSSMHELEALRDVGIQRLDGLRLRVVKAQRTSAIVKMSTLLCILALTIATIGMLITVGFTVIGLIPIVATIVTAVEYRWLSRSWQNTVTKRYAEVLSAQDTYIKRVIDVEDRRQVGLLDPELYAKLERDSEMEKAQPEPLIFKPYADYPPPRWMSGNPNFHIVRVEDTVSRSKISDPWVMGEMTYHKTREGETLAELNHRIVEENKDLDNGRWC